MMNPVGNEPDFGSILASKVDGLNGMRIGLLGNSKPNTDRLLLCLGQRLQREEDTVDFEIHEKSSFQRTGARRYARRDRYDVRCRRRRPG